MNKRGWGDRDKDDGEREEGSCKFVVGTCQ